MGGTPTIEFAGFDAELPATNLLFAASSMKLGRAAAKINQQLDGQLTAAGGVVDFKGQAKRQVSVPAPTGMPAKHFIVAGLGDVDKLESNDWVHVGGRAAGLLAGTRSETAAIVSDAGDAAHSAEIAADLAMGVLLRLYTFDKYKTKKKKNGSDDAGNGEADAKLKTIKILTAKPDAAREAFEASQAVAEGVRLARDLVNEPANVLGPIEFAARCELLREKGVEVEVLDVPALEDLEMGALLGVAQGSARPARVAVMQWHGAKSKRTKPLCFIGKGVVFDTGGISMKPAGGMEDMKGDMGGAACVTGLMAALAGRKAAINAVGIVGLVENMPSGKAQRPGDIVTSKSGQTIEVINTDAEGRLVLCDLLTYAQEQFNPRFMINLATLTGAIIISLGKEYAGLFSNDDKLAGELSEAGEATGEKVWRMPLAKAYDEMINTPNADMKNIGGRTAGSITAAQFLQRFVDDVPWAHLDVAGVAMASGKNDISRTWASGWGVRLLNQLVASKYER